MIGFFTTITNSDRLETLDLVAYRPKLKKNRNVILVGWEKAVSDIFAYHESVVHTEYVASRIRLLFKQLIQYWDIAYNVKPKDWAPVHLVGFSLGAHVAGQIGRLLKRKEKFTIQRITALDPAEPCFEDQDMDLRLTKTDAAFVDVIHTDGAMKKNHGLGLIEPIGHVDFYVNGGFNQPNCVANLKPKFKSYINYMQILTHAAKNGLCQHNRALEIFTETIHQATQKKCKFYAVPWRLYSTPQETKAAQKIECNSLICPEMGINADLFLHYKPENNTFYASTSGEKPFCFLSHVNNFMKYLISINLLNMTTF
ncbi:hypothetical protein TKK_0013968 [Trichogramma kaykai]